MKSKRCAKCIHSSQFGNAQGELMCNYIVDTGTPRGCPVGDECDKFEGRKRTRKIDCDEKLRNEEGEW